MSFVIGCYGVGDGRAERALFAREMNVVSVVRERGFVHVAGDGLHACVVSDEQRMKARLSVAGLASETDVLIEADDEGLKLTREAFGRATLFYTELDGALWFATRLQLLAALLPQRQIAWEALQAYASFSWVAAPLTPLANVFAVAAGSSVAWSSERLSAPVIEPKEAWPVCTELLSDETTAVAQLRALLTEAAGAQSNDVKGEPVGVFLSGGLDSSIAAALLVRASVKVKAFALDFGDHGLSELPYAESVARHLQIPLMKVAATPRRVRQALHETTRTLDLPFGDGVTVPLYLLNQAAAREVRCVFNGEGGDQLFAGWTNKPLIAAGVYESPDAFTTAYLRTFHRLHGYDAAAFTPATVEHLAPYDPTTHIAEALRALPNASLLARLRRANLMLKGAQNIQPRATNLALAHGLQLRTPFCHKPLADWTFGVSDELYLRGACEKYLLKRAVTDWLPPDVVWREKRGMGTPLTAWCLGPLWRTLGRWLDPQRLAAEGVFQSDLALRVATGAFSGHVQGRRIGEMLWLLLMWQLWQATFAAPVTKATQRSFYNSFWLPPRWWQWKYNLANG